MLSQFNLVALNTWGRIKHSHTYQFEHPTHTHTTQIDFLFFRAPHTDNLAKSARTVQAPYVPAKGMRHLPLRATLPMPSEPRSRCPRRAPCKAATVARQLWQDPELADRFRRRVSELQPTSYSGDPAAVLNRVMQQAWHEVNPPNRDRAVVQEHATAGLVRQLWALRRQQKQTPRTYSALRGWLHVVKLAKVQRALKKACRAKKKERIETLLREAEQSRFPSAIFSVVKKLAPKSRTQRIQLRDEEGKLLAGREEAEHIASFLRTVYHSSGVQTAPPVPAITGMSFTPEDLLSALSSLEPAKALPMEFMPARLWKLIPEQVLDMLLPCMNLDGFGLQEEWHKVQLHLIPKISHVKDPKHLRPIALLHPGNKLLASMIARQVQHKVASYLECVPQWAYLPCRSTHDALLSVCAHMNQVRELIQAHGSTLPQRFLGTKRPRMLGGVSISLDVKKAFDSLSHSFLRESMLDAAFTPQEIDLILHLHSQACLQVGQPGQTSDVYLGTGVRQGCSLSPLLWALSTGRFYRLYQEALQQQNLSEGLTNIFADDVFGSWLFRTPQEFKAALRSIGVLVQTLQRVGLALSQDKTVILMATTGTSVASILQKVKRIIEQTPHLEIRVGAERMFFKIASSHVYLGAVITYRNFELMNLKSRLQKAWGCFWRLHHLLINRALSLKARVRLWQTCVFSILRYSLHSMGLPPQGPTMIRQAVNRQLRLIARSPAHLWHTTTEEIYRRVQVEDPWHVLCRQFTALPTRPALVYQVQGIQHWLSTLDATFTISNASSTPISPFVSTSPAQSGLAPTTSVQRTSRGAHAPRSLTCSVCCRVFDSLGALRNHEAHAHRQEKTAAAKLPQQAHTTFASTAAVQHPSPRTRPDASTTTIPYMQSRRQVQMHSQDELLQHGLPERLSAADAQTRFVCLHSTDGLCICRHCRRECHSWDDLKIHIFTKSCSALFPNARDPIFPPFDATSLGCYWDQQLHTLAESGWEAVATYLKSTRPNHFRYCPICGQGLVQARGITLHIQAFHPWAQEALQQARDHTAQHRRSLALSAKCRYCDQIYRSFETKHASECPAIIYAKTLCLLHFPQDQRLQLPLQHGPRGYHEGGAAGGGSRAPASTDAGTTGSQLCTGAVPTPSDAPAGECPPPSDNGGSAHPICDLHDGHSNRTMGRRLHKPPEQVHSTRRERSGGKERTGQDGQNPGDDRTRPAETVSASSQNSEPGTPARLRQSTLEQTGFRRGCIRGPGEQDGAAAAAPRRFHYGAVPVNLVGSLRGDRASSVSGGSPSSPRTGMASHETRLASIHLPTAQDHIVPNVGCRIEKSAGSNLEGPDQQTTGDRTSGNGGTGSVPVQEVECHPTCSRKHPGSYATDAQGGSHTPQRGDHPGDSRGRAGELPCQSSTPGGDAGTHGNVLPRARAPRTEVIQNVEHSGDSTRQCIPHAGCDDATTGKESQVPAGTDDGTGSSSAVTGLNLLRAQLVNQSNDCYANSVLLAVLWTSVLHCPAEASMRQSLHDDLQAPLRSPTPQHIWSRPLMQRCLRRWPHNGRQQDAADFLQHFAQAAQLAHFQGGWSVMSEGSLRDCGGISPLVLQGNLQDLPLHRGICPLQSVIQQWQSTASQPALHAGTQCVAIQLNRFTVVDRAVHKLNTPVSLPRTIHLPRWVEGSLQQSEYRLCAALVHLGSTPHSGHYRALLIEDSGRMWWTDDNVSARPPRKDEAPSLLRNVYIIFLRPSPNASFVA